MQVVHNILHWCNLLTHSMGHLLFVGRTHGHPFTVDTWTQRCTLMWRKWIVFTNEVKCFTFITLKSSRALVSGTSVCSWYSGYTLSAMVLSRSVHWLTVCYNIRDKMYSLLENNNKMRTIKQNRSDINKRSQQKRFSFTNV